MHSSPIDPAFASNGRPMTHFTMIPIEDVPVPASLADKADRPVVLVVDDDPTVTDTLVEILNQSGYAAIAAYDGQEAVDTALLVPPDLVITDVSLHGMSGMEVATTLRTKLPEIKIVLMDGGESASDPLAEGLSAKHDFAVVEKPVHPAELLAKVSASLKSQNVEPAVGVL